MTKKKTTTPTTRTRKRTAKDGSRRDEMPLVLYLIRSGGRDDAYFGRDTFDDFDDGETIGVYELREVRTLQLTRSLR
jgi:hypothetical protein